MNEFIINELCEEDICSESGFFQTLRSLCNEETTDFEKMKSHFRKRKERGVVTFVLRVNGKIVSTMSVVIEYKFIHNEFDESIIAHGEDVATHVDHLKQGYGGALLRHCIDYARGIGCYKLVLTCSFPNVRFYAKHGMNPVEVCMRIDLRERNKPSGADEDLSPHRDHG